MRKGLIDLDNDLDAAKGFINGFLLSIPLWVMILSLIRVYF